MFCSLSLKAQYWLLSGEVLAQCHSPSMSSDVGSADGSQVNLTCQQKPVEPMGIETPVAAASSVAVPPEPDGTKPLLGRKIVAEGRPTPLGSSASTKLADDPGPVP